MLQPFDQVTSWFRDFGYHYEVEVSDQEGTVVLGRHMCSQHADQVAQELSQTVRVRGKTVQVVRRRGLHPGRLFALIWGLLALFFLGVPWLWMQAVIAALIFLLMVGLLFSGLPE